MRKLFCLVTGGHAMTIERSGRGMITWRCERCHTTDESRVETNEALLADLASQAEASAERRRTKDAETAMHREDRKAKARQRYHKDKRKLRAVS